MKRLLNVLAILAIISVSMMSCQKEYNCVCAASNQIVAANSENEAQAECIAKGQDCNIQ